MWIRSGHSIIAATSHLYLSTADIPWWAQLPLRQFVPSSRDSEECPAEIKDQLPKDYRSPWGTWIRSSAEWTEPQRSRTSICNRFLELPYHTCNTNRYSIATVPPSDIDGIDVGEACSHRICHDETRCDHELKIIRWATIELTLSLFHTRLCILQ